MSSVQPASATSARTAQVHAAIAGAARATGVDFNYLLAQARIESNLDPDAAARNSSAGGLYQFLGSTWLDTLDRHAGEHGLGWVSDAIDRSGGRARVTDPGLRAQIINMRFDPSVSAVMAAELASDNAVELQGVLGRAPDSTELYLAHFLGSQGAGQFLTALEADPTRSAADLFPKPAAANRGIFFTREGGERSLGEVMGLLRDKMARAGADDGAGGATLQWAQATGGSAPLAPPAMPPYGGGRPARPAMSELLRTTFIADGSSAAGSDRVRAAYGKLKAFGL